MLTLSGSGTPASPLTFSFTNPQGTTSPVKMIYSTKSVMTYFQCSGITDYNLSGVANNANLVTKVQMPDLSEYTIDYEATPGHAGFVTGRIKSITLPTGGAIIYTYTGANGGIVCSDGTAAGLTRNVDPGGQWTYTRTPVSGAQWTTKVTDPNGNDTQLNFQGLYETSRQVFEASSTLLKTVTTCYNGNLTNCDTTSVTAPITRRTLTLTLPGGKQAKRDTFFDPIGLSLVTDDREYDFGSGTPGPLARKTLITYATLGNGIVDRPASITVKNGASITKAQTNFTYDAGSVTATTGTPQHIAVTGSRGNPTTVSWLVQGTTYLNQQTSYYDTGTIKSITNPNTALTTIEYAAGSCGNSFPTKMNLPLGLSQSFTWNCYGAVQTSVTEANERQTTFTYAGNNYWRLTGISYPDGGSASFTYNTATSPWSIVRSVAMDSSRSATTKTVLDGWARVQQQQLTSDPNGTVYADITYTPVGRVASISNPYHAIGDVTYGITSYDYDPLGRPTKITRPDATFVSVSYTMAATQVQDEGRGGTARITRVFQKDGLGRLISVCEVSSEAQMGNGGTPTSCGQDIAATGFLTTYGYDALSNITSVAQNGLNPRTYAYDGLSRLTSESNPESGTATYAYDTVTKGDLYQRTRPKPNQTNPLTTVVATFTYDLLHRLTAVSYNDGVTQGASFGYDESTYWGITLTNPKGRLTHGTVSGAGTIYGYDTMGRIKDEWQCTPLNCGSGSFGLHYNYDWLGNVTSLVNGREAKTYTYTYDTAARLTNLQSSWNDANHPGTVFTVNAYNAIGLVQQATLGSGIVRTQSYDDRGRLTSLADGSLFSFTLGYAADGNILTANDSVNGNWTYTYDDFGRLATSSKAGMAFNYKYDRFGNRWQQNVTVGVGPNPSYVFDANNHITGSGVTYDAAGNVTNDGSHSYTYDAEGRLLNVDATSVTYIHDAFGERVRQTVNGSPYDYIFDESGRAIDQVTATNWTRGEIHAGALHVATYTNSTTYFDHADWLGTRRLLSSVSGSSVETCTSLPFGDAQTCTGTDWTPLHFTGSELDSQSNLHHFWFRQLSTTQGRWTIPDPAGLAAVAISNPQSWNRYAYVLNNPCALADPLGLGDCTVLINLASAKHYLSNSELSDATGRISALLGQAGVDVAFSVTPTPDSDYGPVFSLGVAPGSFGIPNPGKFGETQPGSTIGTIWLQSIHNEVKGQNVGTATGSVVAHEFVAHTVGGARFSLEPPNPDALEVEGGDAYKMLNPNLAIQDAKLLKKVLDWCKNRRRGGGGGPGGVFGGPISPNWVSSPHWGWVCYGEKLDGGYPGGCFYMLLP